MGGAQHGKDGIQFSVRGDWQHLDTSAKLCEEFTKKNDQKMTHRNRKGGSHTARRQSKKREKDGTSMLGGVRGSLWEAI